MGKSEPRMQIVRAVGARSTVSGRRGSMSGSLMVGVASLGLISLIGFASQVQAVSPPKTTHWSFQPIRKPAPPNAVSGRNSGSLVPRHPIDAFVESRLKERGLASAPQADRRTLIRRLTLDLTGIPPTYEATQEFLKDRSPGAYENLVDRLLASPQFGVRWAQHWLDVARFGETNGFEVDGDRAQAWRYRDWVVDALNSDLPYDRFITLQIAGDLLEPQSFASRVATGFLRAGPQHIVGGNQDRAELRQEWLTEAVTGIGAGILGLTIQCARCHDHKFDPIPQTDYYRLQAYFAAVSSRDWKPENPAEELRIKAAREAIETRQRPINEAIAAIEKPHRERLMAERRAALTRAQSDALAVAPAQRTAAQRRLAEEAQTALKISWDQLVAVIPPHERVRRSALRRQLFDIDLERPEPAPVAPGVAEATGGAVATHVLIRGDIHTPGPRVTEGVPAVLARETQPRAEGRIALAGWLTDSRNPLTARVYVNRVWKHLFGRGIVATPNDFGRFGAAPTHPELLDWLAATFTAPETGDAARGCGNRLKQLIRLIVTSRTYRQSSNPTGPGVKRDPSNELFWRQNRERLDAEALRDSMLTAAGSINPKLGGPPVRVPLEPEVYDQIFTEGEPDNLWEVTPDRTEHRRRTLYLLRKRNVRLPLLAVFDQPDMMTSCGARQSSIHALQALSLMNSDFARQRAAEVADRLLSSRATADAARITQLFRWLLQRDPTAVEVRAAGRLLSATRQASGPPGSVSNGSAERTAWNELALGTLNLNEFAFVR